ncbi:MAG: tetratricopeptide repeat protein [candidate division Zixibacteria bacterium]|nr:tetratricopeptide repeat protein [candidate division Zixibacteria bacterium]
MSPEKRITKRQMKQDNFVTTALKASEYVQQRKNYFVGGIAAVVAVIAIIYFINYSFAQKAIDAERLFGKAQVTASMNQTALAIADYKTLIEDYASTDVADRACYFLAKTLFDMNDRDSALVYFELYINNFGKDKMLLGAAYNGGANCLEDKEDFNSAGDYYFKAAEATNDDVFSPGYYMNAGRSFYKAGQLEKATEAYQFVVDNYRTSTYYSIASKKLAEVKYGLE